MPGRRARKIRKKRVKGTRLLQQQAAQEEIRKLTRIARRRGGTRADAEDAVASALARFWEEGCKWSEGRLVLEVKSHIRNARRAHEARTAREDRYAELQSATNCEGDG